MGSTSICDAFTYLHSRGLVHRDIKPANFFLKDDLITVGDLGLAKSATDEGVARYYRGDITATGEFVGPVLWMSPELIAYQKDKKAVVDHRSDIFQIGLVLWFMLTGVVPCGQPDEDDDPTEGQLLAIFSKATKQKTEKRYQSIAEMTQALQALKI